MFWVFAQAVQKLELDPYAGAACVGLALSLAAYLGVASAGSMSTEYLSLLIAVFLAMGAMSSALNTANPAWWQQHFSSLAERHRTLPVSRSTSPSSSPVSCSPHWPTI